MPLLLLLHLIALYKDFRKMITIIISIQFFLCLCRRHTPAARAHWIIFLWQAQQESFPCSFFTSSYRVKQDKTYFFWNSLRAARTHQLPPKQIMHLICCTPVNFCNYFFLRRNVRYATFSSCAKLFELPFSLDYYLLSTEEKKNEACGAVIFSISERRIGRQCWLCFQQKKFPHTEKTHTSFEAVRNYSTHCLYRTTMRYCPGVQSFYWQFSPFIYLVILSFIAFYPHQLIIHLSSSYTLFYQLHTFTSLPFTSIYTYLITIPITLAIGITS